MKILKVGIVLTISLLFAGGVAAKEFKLGVVDIARILEESPQADAARGKMQKEFEPRQKRLMESEDKIRELEEQLSRDGAIMSESERSKLERNIMAKKRDLKRNQDEFRDDVAFKRNEILEGLQRSLIETIRDFAKKESYDILFAEGVIYASDAVNITEEVLTALKNKKP